MPKKQQKMASNKKNARKQTHSKIQFYIEIHKTKVEKNIFLKSPCPIGQVRVPHSPHCDQRKCLKIHCRVFHGGGIVLGLQYWRSTL